MGYSTGSHSIFHHRYHIVWAPKYRYKVLRGEVRLRVRDIIRQVRAEMGVTIVNGARSQDHVHMFVEIPPHKKEGPPVVLRPAVIRVRLCSLKGGGQERGHR